MNPSFALRTSNSVLRMTDRPSADRSARACIVSSLGRMAADSGQWITYAAAFASNLELAPHLDSLRSLEDPAPVQPDTAGNYPVPVPGQTQVL